MKARYVVMSNEPLNRPKLPGIAGLEGFEGHCFHTSRWDYGYTRRAGYDITGRDGQTLSGKWSEGVAAQIGAVVQGLRCVLAQQRSFFD